MGHPQDGKFEKKQEMVCHPIKLSWFSISTF